MRFSDEQLLARNHNDIERVKLACSTLTTFRHNKTGNLYRVTGWRLNSDTTKVMVDYVSLTSGIPWSRNVEEFFDGRYTELRA